MEVVVLLLLDVAGNRSVDVLRGERWSHDDRKEAGLDVLANDLSKEIKEERKEQMEGDSNLLRDLSSGVPRVNIRHNLAIDLEKEI